MSRTKNSRAVVTGAGSGLGEAFALELARRGGRVVCADIDAARVVRTAAAIREAGGEALAVTCDVSALEQVQELALAAAEFFGGPPDLVVNNAGVGSGGLPVGELPLEDWEWVLGVNLWGVVYGCHVFAPLLREQGRGGIINVSSAASFAALPMMSAYNASKAAVLSLSETMAAELAGTGVAVTVLCPTFVRTNITRDGRIAGNAGGLADALMERTGKPPTDIVRTTLDAHDKGRLHVVPQRDAKLIWRLKRVAPATYTRALGLGLQLTNVAESIFGDRQPATAMDLDAMLAKIKERQWALADIDWDAPGADQVTEEQWADLRTFMIDLVWIEQIGGRAFAAMAKKAPTDTLREIYRYFHAEEQKHANAELALMKRWGMLADGEAVPEPNVNSRLAIDWLDSYADSRPLVVLGTIIPMLEVALDGALLKFLLDEVTDPVCQEVFAKVNADESRHLAVDFHVLETLGAGPLHRLLIQSAGSLLSVPTLIGLLNYTPLLSRMRDSVITMGLSEEGLYSAIDRFGKVGDRSRTTPRNPMYRALRFHGTVMVKPGHPFHRVVGDPLVKLTSHYPRRLLGAMPTWSRELTHEPVQ